MLTLPALITAHLDDDPYNAAHLFEITDSSPHYWTDWSQDLIWNGHTWLHTMPFNMGQIVTDAEGIQDVSVTFDEQLHQLQGYDETEGMGNRKIRIHEARVATDGVTVIEVMQDIASGSTGSLDFDETDANSTGTLSLGSSSAMNAQNGPRNQYDLSCVNGYQDARCKYAWPLSIVAAGITAGSRTVTPAAGMPSGILALILAGSTLFASNADGSNSESIIVTSVTGTTFTATFASAKSAGWRVSWTAAPLPSCQRTYADCLVHTNTSNFRGCRHALTAPQTIQWGAGAVILNTRSGA